MKFKDLFDIQFFDIVQIIICNKIINISLEFSILSFRIGFIKSLEFFMIHLGFFDIIFECNNKEDK